MTVDELTRVIDEVAMRWPNNPVPPPAFRVWADDLACLPFADCIAVVREHARTGREFPPTSGQIFGTVADKLDGSPEWGEAWAEMREKAQAELDARRYPRIDLGDDMVTGSTPPAWSHPVVRQAAMLIGFVDIAEARRGDTAFEYQARDVYRSVREQARASSRELLPALTRGTPAVGTVELVGRLAEAMTP